VVTALSFYFGWARLDAEASYFGLDPSVLGLSTQDYLLRSADVLFIPLGALLTAGLLAVVAHSLLRDRLRRHPRAVRYVTGSMVAVGAALFALGALAAWRGLPFATPFLFPQLSPGLGMALLAYGVRLRGDVRGGHRPRGRIRLSAAVGSSMVFMLVVLSLFWATAEYAGALGRGRAQDLAAHLLRQPGVIVYSREKLGIDAPGVLEARIGDASAAYRYRYTGLRLLLRSGGNYYLVPALWSPQNGVVIALQDRESSRIEFTRGLAQ
jgi:hypothetical protein